MFLPQQPVPATADVAIMGAGYTGLSAAITLARAGRCVDVFDKMRPGGGASTRNGGITSGNLRPSHSQMSRKFSEPRADGILAEPKAAREDLYRFIADEKIDCDFATTGRFSGASAPRRPATTTRWRVTPRPCTARSASRPGRCSAPSSARSGALNRAGFPECHLA